MSQFDDPDGALPPPQPDASPPLDDDEETRAVEADPALGDRTYAYGEPELPHVLHEQLDRGVVLYWLLTGVLSWLFLLTFLGVGAATVYSQWPETVWPYVWPPAATLAALSLVWTLISPSLAYTRWRFSVDSELLLARFGIFFIEEKAIPISRLQHVDLYRGMVERMFGLTTLIVFTAGTEGAHFRLPGLSVARARQLRDMIIAARGDDVI